MTNYSRGAIVLVLFPNSDLLTAKRRPAIVVQAENLNTGIEQIIVAMITSNLARRNHPARIYLSRNSPEGETAGILTDSVLMCDNIATVRFKEIDQTLGHFNDVTALDKALRTVFAC